MKDTMYPIFVKNMLKKGFKNYSPNEIKDIRNKANVTQDEFSEFFFATKSTIKKWEQGKRTPSCSSMRLLQFVELMANDRHQNINNRIRRAYR